jgi:mercuric ion transport protein
MSSKAANSGVLAFGGLAAILASSCCLGPLILVMLGFGGAWIGNLSALEPYRPMFLGFTVIALVIAAYRLYRPQQLCDADGNCATPKSLRLQKGIFVLVTLLAIVGFVFPYVARFFY